jgi:hypothetical protein
VNVLWHNLTLISTDVLWHLRNLMAGSLIVLIAWLKLWLLVDLFHQYRLLTPLVLFPQRKAHQVWK